MHIMLNIMPCQNDSCVHFHHPVSLLPKTCVPFRFMGLLRQSRFEWKVPLQHPQALVFRAPQHTERPDPAGSFNEMTG